MVFLLILKVLLIIFLLSAALLFLIHLIGLFLVRQNSVTLTNSYFHTPEDIYKTLLAVEEYPAWRTDLADVKARQNGTLYWKEYFHQGGGISYALTEVRKPQQIVLEIRDNKFPVNLTRRFIIWRQDYLSFLKVEDQFTINRGYLRFFSKLFYDHQGYVRNMMKKLDHHLDVNFESSSN